MKPRGRRKLGPLGRLQGGRACPTEGLSPLQARAGPLSNGENWKELPRGQRRPASHRRGPRGTEAAGQALVPSAAGGGGPGTGSQSILPLGTPPSPVLPSSAWVGEAEGLPRAPAGKWGRAERGGAAPAPPASAVCQAPGAHGWGDGGAGKSGNPVNMTVGRAAGTALHAGARSSVCTAAPRTGALTVSPRTLRHRDSCPGAGSKAAALPLERPPKGAMCLSLPGPQQKPPAQGRGGGPWWFPPPGWGAPICGEEATISHRS